MCGVVGFWHFDKRPMDGAPLRRMTRAQAHRGPDAEGYYEAPGIGLGHRRLSVIDLSTGGQPLCSEDGSVWGAFNGEIFNYVELRADLDNRGYVFKTRSDTETLVHLYEEKGLDFVVDELNRQRDCAVGRHARPAGARARAAAPRADLVELLGRRRHLSATAARPRGSAAKRFPQRAAVEKLLVKGAADGAAPSECNEMALATMASLQLLQHLFVDNFQPSGSEVGHEERTAVAL
jgi:hypothetical protein